MLMRGCVPNGLEHTKGTYPTEAGWARTVRAQVSADTIAQMHTIKLDSEYEHKTNNFS
jgi:hypothetical protein